MKCQVIAHEFNTSENGNIYCKLEVKPANDEWAASFNYVMFVTEAMQTTLEANFPKFIYLEEKRMKTPEPFYRVWATDGPGYSQGEFVSRPNREDPDNPTLIVFNDIKVVIRTMPDGTPARGENAEKLLESQWNRGIANGTIIPVSYYGDNSTEDNAVNTADPFAGASTADPAIAEQQSQESQQPKQPQQQGRPGITVPGRR